MKKRLKQFITSDIPFARDDAHRMLPAMVACLVGFATLLLATALCLSHVLDTQTRDVAGVLQVEVPSTAASDTVEKTVTVLRSTRGVDRVNVLHEADMEKLLKPWLGSGFSIGDLPVPTLIDVTTRVEKGQSAVNLPNLQQQLELLDKNIRIASQGPWVSQFASALSLLQALVLMVAILLLICVTGMIVLVARTNLKLHFKTVGLLHMFGATDDYILTQFQWNSAWLAARGAMAGVGFAALMFLAAVLFSHRVDSPVIPQISFSAMHLITFIMLPVLTALVALVATRLTVQSMLRHMH
jgi:cell division transport system permease protein